MNSKPYKGKTRDPAKLAENQEILKHYETARNIFKRHQETAWEGQLSRLPEDQRPEVRRCLYLIKEHAPQCQKI